MAHDFELRRLTDKLKKLSEEQARVNQQILRSRREEQMELEYVRRRFNGQIHALEVKQKKVTKDMSNYERQLHNLEKRIEDDKKELEHDDSFNQYGRH